MGRCRKPEGQGQAGKEASHLPGGRRWDTQQRYEVAAHTEALLWLQSCLPNISPDVTGGISLQHGLGTTARRSPCQPCATAGTPPVLGTGCLRNSTQLILAFPRTATRSRGVLHPKGQLVRLLFASRIFHMRRRWAACEQHQQGITLGGSDRLKLPCSTQDTTFVPHGTLLHSTRGRRAAPPRSRWEFKPCG